MGNTEPLPMQGENTWVFVSEDAIADTIKHYFKFEDELLTEAKKVAPKNAEVKPPTELSVVVMDGKLLTPKEVRAASVATCGQGWAS